MDSLRAYSGIDPPIVSKRPNESNKHENDIRCVSGCLVRLGYIVLRSSRSKGGVRYKHLHGSKVFGRPLNTLTV